MRKQENPEEYAKLVADKSKHVRDMRGRKALAKGLEKQGLDGAHLFVMSDGANSQKTWVPNTWVHTKQEHVHAISYKTQGFMIPGVGCWDFLVAPWIRTGGNFLCTVLVRALALTHKRLGSLPSGRYKPNLKKLVLSVDGGSENWNKTVFRFLCLLVYLGHFDTIIIVRGVPAHGHNRLDGVFGYTNQKAHGRKRGERRTAGMNIFTMEGYIQMLRDALKVTSENADMPEADLVHLLEFVFDFEEFLQPVLPHMQGIGAGARSDFTFGENATVVRATVLRRGTCPDEGEAGTGKRRVYISAKTGFSDNDLNSGWMADVEVDGLDCLNLAEGPESADYDQLTLDSYREAAGDLIINQFRSSADDGGLELSQSLLRTAARDDNSIIESWISWKASLPTCVAARRDTLRRDGSDPVNVDWQPNVLSWFEHTEMEPALPLGGYAAEEGSIIAVGTIARFIEDEIKRELHTSAVVFNEEQKSRHLVNVRELKARAARMRDMAVARVQALEKSYNDPLQKGELVVVAMLGETLPYMVAEVASVSDDQPNTFTVRWWTTQTLDSGPPLQAGTLDELKSSIETVRFVRHTATQTLDRSMLVLRNARLNADGKFNDQVRSWGLGTGGTSSTKKEMLDLVDMGLLCK